METSGRPRIIAVSNIKGGVAKTTSTVNLGACFAEMGYRTLIIDFDPQGNATEALGVDARDSQKTIYDVLVDDQDGPIDDAIEATAVKNLFVLPANLNLAGAELELASVIGREQRLKLALETIADQWDFILIDCQPSVGLLAVNALTAADEVLTPVQTEYQALLGVKNLSKTLNLIRKTVNPDLKGPTFLLTMYQRRNLDDTVVRDMRAAYGDRVLATVIPRNVRLSEAPIHGLPITVFDPSCAGAQAYREAAKEIANGTQKRAG